MKKINKIILFIISFFSISFVKANELYNIDMNITLDEDGNAHVVEKWKMNNTKDTEVYKAMYNMGNMEISDFEVSLNNQKYTYIDSWDIDASFDEKSYKNGLNYTNNGVELCFGISTYGTNEYTFSYTIKNFIFKTSDADLIYFKFIDGMSIMNNTSYSITIAGPYTYPDTLDVWGYGTKGYTYVSDGKIYSSNSEGDQLDNSSYYVMLVKYPLNTFNTTNSYSDYNTFDDVYSLAEEGTFDYDYDYDNDGNIISNIFSYLPCIVFILLTIFGYKKLIDKAIKYKFESLGRKIDMKEINNFRDIPCNKDIFRAYFLSQAYKLNKNNTDFIGSIFLKWIYENKISIVKEQKKGIFKSVEETSIKFNSENFENIVEERLYNILKDASKDGTLSSNELKNYCKNNYTKLFDWFEKAEEYGRSLYITEGFVYKDKSKYVIKDTLKEEAIKVAGLKKYLIEFSNMSDKESLEVKLWKEYLMFAQIFGIADKVSKEFEKLYPEVIHEMEECNYSITDIMFLNDLGRSAVNAASAARNAAENYSSGGGGFTSGGGGGGSFGGGGGGTR